MNIKKIIHKINPLCSKCPYKLGLVQTPVNPCPQCKLNGYRAFEIFQKHLPTKKSATDGCRSSEKEDSDINRIKLPRVTKALPYTTGDAQKWTYQYTWEDWEAAVVDDRATDWCTEYSAVGMFLLDYFFEHPEFVQDHRDFKGYTLNQIRWHMHKRKERIHYSEQQVSALRKLWAELLDCRNREEQA